MAKKRHRVTKEEEKEEYQFIPSEFDEREFILKDIYGTKVLFIIVALAVVVGIVGAILYHVSPSIGWAPATAIAFLMVLGMKKLLMLLGYRVDLLETKTLLADYLLFLMLALGICILGINL